MSSLDAIKKELGSLITKRIMAALGAKQSGKSSEDPLSSLQNTTAWKEIEHKLQDLFSHDELDGRSGRDQTMMYGAGALVLLLLVAYLLGRRQGKRRSTILEVHKA